MCCTVKHFVCTIACDFTRNTRHAVQTGTTLPLSSRVHTIVPEPHICSKCTTGAVCSRIQEKSTYITLRGTKCVTTLTNSVFRTVIHAFFDPLWPKTWMPISKARRFLRDFLPVSPHFWRKVRTDTTHRESLISVSRPRNAVPGIKWVCVSHCYIICLYLHGGYQNDCMSLRPLLIRTCALAVI